LGKAERASPAPKPGSGAAAQAAAAPAFSAGDAASLQTTLISVRSFLKNHPWFKDDEDVARLVGQLNKGVELVEKLMAAAISTPSPKPGKPADKKAEAAGPPRCPSCKQPITPGDTFCQKCGAAL
jgi:hypothetical protein